MGYNTTVVVLNDALGAIERDPEFGKKLVAGIMEMAGRRPGDRPIDVSASNHCNAVSVIETHHADETAIVTVGGNYGTLQARSWGYSHHTPEGAEHHLRQWADKLGFTLHKKPKKES